MIQAVDTRACIGCRVCELICPGDVIRVKGNKAEIAFAKDCWTCFACELNCPVKAINVHPFRRVRPTAW